MVGLLIVTHDSLGEALLRTASGTLGYCPLVAEVLPVGCDTDPEERCRAARHLVRQLDQGDGVLVLTDMFGSTPSNVACSLLDLDQVRVIAGINLPMLIRVFNYPNLDLDALTIKAVSGGHDGIMACGQPEQDRIRHAQ